MRKNALRFAVLAFALATAAFASLPPSKSGTARTCGNCGAKEYCCEYHGGLCLPIGFPCP